MSFRCNICPDCNLDVSLLFKNSNAGNFSFSRVLPVKSSSRTKFYSNGFRGKMWISQILRFELIWGLRGGKTRLIYCIQFSLPHNLIGEQAGCLCGLLHCQQWDTSTIKHQNWHCNEQMENTLKLLWNVKRKPSHITILFAMQGHPLNVNSIFNNYTMLMILQWETVR